MKRVMKLALLLSVAACSEAGTEPEARLAVAREASASTGGTWVVHYPAYASYCSVPLISSISLAVQMATFPGAMMPRAMGRPRQFELTLSATEHTALEAMAASRTLPYSHVRRAQIVLASAAGEPSSAIAARFEITQQTVGYWRKRFQAQRLAGLADAPRPGHQRTHDDERVAGLLRTVLETKPLDGEVWTVRGLAAETGISKSVVQRYLSLFGVQPHRTKSFTLSTDPFFVEKVRDIVGLYLNPPDHALVLCVDEKSQVQALERAQPVLPMGLGYVEGVTHGYIRHGTTTLFAALDIASGEILTQCKARHRHQEFLDFLRHIDANVPGDLDIHLVLDNYATHKHPKVRAWLAARPRYHVHYTPTYSSWLNQVERWFGHVTQRVIKRGSFRTTQELIRRIETFVDHYNTRSRPFSWTATADSILAKLGRLLLRISGTSHYVYVTETNTFSAGFQIPAGTPVKTDHPSNELIAGVEYFFQSVGRVAPLVETANGLQLGGGPGGCTPVGAPCDPWQPMASRASTIVNGNQGANMNICGPIYWQINSLAAQATGYIEQIRETTGSISAVAGEIAPPLAAIAYDLEFALEEWRAYACSPTFVPKGEARVPFEPSPARRPAMRKMRGVQWFHNTATGQTFSRPVFWSERSWTALGSNAPVAATNIAPDVQ